MLRENEVPFLLPGILSGGASFQALGFDTTDVVEYDDPGEDGFDVRRIVHETTTMITTNLNDGFPTLLVGASLGGMLIPFIVDELRENLKGWGRENLLSSLRCVIIDSPFGVESMIAAGRSPIVGRLIRSPFGQLLRPLASIKVGPKDGYIEVPDGDVMREIADRVMPVAEWREYVKRRAIAELGGHSSKQWLEQLRWMTQVGHDGSLYRACKSLKGVDTTYLACMGPGNDVIEQPVAMMQWKRSVPDLRLVERSVVHCGFLQQAPTFRGVLAEILG